ncbi:hypothetical protein ABL78_1418 [Leptomonas seymouri]|uniref:Uncharacterized protein n=1 Tax=Leptomonas seymouri TaxID=5684 RepID=A0A0N1PE00_LEPSE|nr:hypothetical protein ABL78_1418 [Leptomonas seymouri]|eukprot:KPI89454.1 hypothetical protein ABL78_1418 [Leptomonas seymouri]
MPATSPTASAAPFSPEEVRALVFPLIPCVPGTSLTPSQSNRLHLPSISTAEVLRQLPKALRGYLEKYRQSVSPAAEPKCEIWEPPRARESDKVNKMVAAFMSGGICAYMADHFPEEVVIVMPGGRLARKEAPAATTANPTDTSSPSETDTYAKARSSRAGDSEGKAAGAYSASSPTDENTVPKGTVASLHSGELESVLNPNFGLRSHTGGTAPPPPPQPVGPSQRYGGNVGSSAFFGAAPVGLSGGAPAPPSNSSFGKTASDVHSDPTAVPLRTTIQLMDVLVEYIPTFYTPVEEIEPLLPSSLQQLYRDTSLRFFLKRFKHYLDMRTAYNTTEVRLKPNFDHPKRGVGDTQIRHDSTGNLLNANQLRRPPRSSEANLIGLIAPRVPRVFTPLADVLQEISPIVSRHPAFDSRLGVTGLLGKYPEYFQVVDGRLRARPYREAPNSLRDLDRNSSPLPAIFAKVWACVEEAAAGKNYAEVSEKAAAMVSTGRLYSLLSAPEKAEVKQKCRSFPTFLRMHGKELVVSVDKMRVYKFLPEYEACVDTLMDERLRMNSLDPNDPILKIPAVMAPESNAEWAVSELYDALPLMQCAELDEVLSLVPHAVRNALPKEVSDVRSLLEQYGEYFTIWPYPDNESVIVVQRAKVEEPVLDKAEIVRMVVPLIPQGGTTLTALRTRVPLLLQRYFYRHGTVATLGAMKEIFAIVGDRIVRLV